MSVRSNPRESFDHARTRYARNIEPEADPTRSFERAQQECSAYPFNHATFSEPKDRPHIDINYGGTVHQYHLEPHDPATSFALAQEQLRQRKL